MNPKSPLAVAFLFAVAIAATVSAGAIPGMPKDPAAVGLTGEPHRQYAMVLHDLGRRARFQQLADQAYDRHSLILESDRDPLDVMLRRTSA